MSQRLAECVLPEKRKKETLRIRWRKGIHDTMAEKGMEGGKLMYRDKGDCKSKHIYIYIYI